MRYSEMKVAENRRLASSSRPHDPRRRESPVWRWLVLGLLGVLALLFLAGCASPQYRDTAVPMATNGPVDLQRYKGLWYEIARYPNSFEEGCTGVTAEYALNDDGSVKVTNTCRQGALDGAVEIAEGRAVSTTPDNDKLLVGFVEWLPFARGDYWILFTDYDISVVGTPSGSLGWILARTPKISDARIADATAVLVRNGYDPAGLILTLQSE